MGSLFSIDNEEFEICHRKLKKLLLERSKILEKCAVVNFTNPFMLPSPQSRDDCLPDAHNCWPPINYHLSPKSYKRLSCIHDDIHIFICQISNLYRRVLENNKLDIATKCLTLISNVNNTMTMEA